MAAPKSLSATAAPAIGTGVTLLGNNTTVTGDPPPARPVFSADGSRAALITPVTNFSTHTTTTQVALINTVTGQQVGSTLTLSGFRSLEFTADGTRALITTSVPDTTTGVNTTRVTLINTTTGAQVGTFPGSQSGKTLLSADGTRALITIGVRGSTGVMVFNTTTGTQIGATVALPGSPADTMPFGTDGGRALVTTSVSSSIGNVTVVAMIDTTTGNRIGTPVVLAGVPLALGVGLGLPGGTTPLGTDGSRALVTSFIGSSLIGGFVTLLTVIDTTTGTQIGTPIVLSGSPAGTMLFGADGGRALIKTSITHGTDSVSQVAVIDTTTGTRVGTPLVLPGSDTVLFRAGSSRALVRAYVGDTTAGNATVLAVIDTTTGARIGTPVVLAGSPVGTQLLGADAGRALITTAIPNGSAVGSQVAVIDTTTGAQIGTPVVLAGSPTGTTPLGISGSRALITTQTASSSPYDACDSSNCITRVAVINTATGQQIGSTVTLTGRSLPPVLSANGSHALITTQEVPANEWNPNKVHVALINTTTGSQIGATFTGDVTAMSAGVSAGFNADGTRALFTTYDLGTNTTKVAVINTTTDAQIGTPLALPGDMADVLFSPDRTRTVITTRPLIGGHYVTQLAVMNTLTGTQIGATVTLSGETTGASYAEFTDDGSRLVLATPVYRPGGSTADKDMRIAVINTATGAQMGTVLTLPGGFDGIPRMLTAGGTRALIVTHLGDGLTQPYSSRVAVIDTATGTQVGTTLTIAANIAYHPLLLSANGSHALLSYTTTSIFGATTQLMVINTLTGTQTGSITLPDAQYYEPLVSADGTRILITTAHPNSYTSVTTRVAVLRIV